MSEQRYKWSSVSLRPLRPDNWKAATKLRVTSDQSGLICTNERSLAEACARPEEADVRIIYVGEEPAGLMVLMYVGDHVEVHRMMVDGRFQGEGVGTIALQRTLSRVLAERSNVEVIVKFLHWNTDAERLYSKLGFEDTGRREEDEKVFRLKWDLVALPGSR